MKILNMGLLKRIFGEKKSQSESQTQILDKLLPVLRVVDAEVSKLKHEVDVINAKLKSKWFKKKEEEGLEGKTEETESNIKDDGFDEIRNLRKNGVF